MANDGPRRLPRQVREEIVERLRGFVSLHFPSVRKFGERLDVSTGTTSGWFGRTAALPDAPALYRMNQDLGMSLDWLMTGRGEAVLPVGVPGRDLKTVLREELIAELVRHRVPREIAERFTPSGTDVLAEVLQRHWHGWRHHAYRTKLLQVRASRGRPSIGRALEAYLASLPEPRGREPHA